MSTYEINNSKDVQQESWFQLSKIETGPPTTLTQWYHIFCHEFWATNHF